MNKLLVRLVTIEMMTTSRGRAEIGENKIEWALKFMPVLSIIKKDFSERKPLKGKKISATLHVTKETAVLMRTLESGGATTFLTPSNPLSTDEDVAAALESGLISVRAWRGMTEEEYFGAIDWAHSQDPDIIIDDGADSIVRAHINGLADGGKIIGALEETTTGVIRTRALQNEGKLKFPVIAVNEAQTKKLFDNRYGTGQSSLDGIIRATSIMLAGKSVVIAGYGLVGRGIAVRARGLGGRVIVTEVSHLRALEAIMEGYEVMPMEKAAEIGDIFITATGNKKVITTEHMLKMKDGAIMANSGHFDVEIDVKALRDLAISSHEVRPYVEEFTLPGGKRVMLLAQGRLVNLVCAEGHPPDVMDMSFSNQALCAEYLIENRAKIKENIVFPVPEEVDKKVASLKLSSMGIQIDKLTKEQEEYLRTWKI